MLRPSLIACHLALLLAGLPVAAQADDDFANAITSGKLHRSTSGTATNLSIRTSSTRMPMRRPSDCD